MEMYGKQQKWYYLLFGCYIMSESLQPHGLQEARLPLTVQFPRLELEWVAIPFSRGLPDPGIIPMSAASLADFFTILTTREAPILCTVVCVCQSQFPNLSQELTLLKYPYYLKQPTDSMQSL